MFTRPKDKTILSFSGSPTVALARLLLESTPGVQCSETLLRSSPTLQTFPPPIFLQFYLHFTTDYTCMIVYVTNNKEPLHSFPSHPLAFLYLWDRFCTYHCLLLLAHLPNHQYSTLKWGCLVPEWSTLSKSKNSSPLLYMTNDVLMPQSWLSLLYYCHWSLHPSSFKG